MSDLSEEEDSMEEDDSGEELDSSEEEESGEESGSESESANEESHSEMNDLTVKNVQQQELSSSSDEGNERDRCPVCLNRFIGQDLGIPENCEHIFCFDCIKEWATNINTCPIDRNEFNFVHLKRSPDGKILKKVRVHVHSKEPEEGTLAEESTLCEVCRLGDREHRLLLCDACDLAYHCDCLDPPLFHIPIEEWFCPPCSSVMTQMGDRALPSTSRSRRVIPRTSASESVRVRVQNRRTYPSTISRSTTTPKKRKRRTYRRSRCIKKVVKLARTKAGGGGGKSGKTDRATAVMVTYRKKYRRRKRRKTKRKSTRLPTKSAESNLQSAKERIAKRLGLCKARTGTAIPDVRTKPGPSSQSSSSDRTHSLFGARDQLMDFNENFNEDIAVPSTSTSTPRNRPGRSEPSAAPSNILDSILAGQELLHAKSDNVIIRNDGSLIRKDGDKKKISKEKGGTSKSVVRVGLYKPVVSSKHATQERAKGSSSSLLHGALTKKKSSESHSSSKQKTKTISSNSAKEISEKTRKIKKEKQETIEGSSSSSKKISDSSTKHREKCIPSSSISTGIASKRPIKIEKPIDKHVSAKDSKRLYNNPAASSYNTFVSEPTNSNLSGNKKQSEKSTSFNVQDNAADHRLDILQKRASFLEKFNTKPSASASKEHSEYSIRNQLSTLSDESNTFVTASRNEPKLKHQTLGIKSTSPQTNEIKIKDEPLSSDDEEAHSESLIGQASFDNIFPKTLKTEFEDSESLIGNTGTTSQFFSTSLNSSTTVNSSKLEVIRTTIKNEPVSSDEESISPMSDNCNLFGSKTRIKEEPDESVMDKQNDSPFIQAVEHFEDLPCTQAVESFEDLPRTQAVERFEDLPCTQAVERFEDLPCTQAVERFEDLPCTQAVDCFEDLPCTQAVDPFEDLPCTQAVERFEDLPCTQAVERFEDLPCTQTVERFEDLPCTQVADKLPNETVFKVPKSRLPITVPPIHTSEVSIPSKLSSKHPDINKSKALVDNSDLPATQPSAQVMPNISTQDISVSKKCGKKHLVSSSKQEDNEDNNLLNASLLDDEELLDAKKAVALLRSGCNKAKSPPKVVGVHRNLPQVIASAPVRRPLVPKPINKRTFSFDQVKQHFNLEEPQKNNLSNTEINSKVSTHESHLPSDSDSDHLSKSRQTIPNITTLCNSIHTPSHQTNSKDLCKDCKGKTNSNNLLDSTTDPKLIKPSLNKETLQDVSNIEVNVVNKLTQSLCQSKEQFQPPRNIPQMDCFTSRYIKKEPLDKHEDTMTQTPCAVKKVVEHVGESNLARALRIKREMNAEVLQQNAFKGRVNTTKDHEVRNVTGGSNMLRALSIKQEMNLEVMRGNMLQASLENSRHVNETSGNTLVANGAQIKHGNDHKVKAEKKSLSMHIKTEKDDELNTNHCLEKDRGICKESEFKFNAKCIKKEPGERQEKYSKSRSDSFDKTLEKGKKHKSNLCNKEGKDNSINKESNLEKIKKPIENNECKNNRGNDKCKERNPPSKNKNICAEKNCDNKYAEKDHGHKESNSERKSKLQEKDRQESKEKNYDGNKRMADKDHLTSKERSNNSVKEQVKRQRDSEVKNNYANEGKNDSMASICDSRHRQVDKNKHFKVEENSHSKNKYIEKDKHYNKERSAAENDKNGNKESSFDRKNKHLEIYESNSKEKSQDNKTRHDAKDNHGSKNKNLYNKDKHVDKDKHGEKDQRCDKYRHGDKDKHSKKDQRGDKYKHGEKDKRGENDKHSSRVNYCDRKQKHSENNNHNHKEIDSNSKIKHSEKDQYDVKQNKCDRNNKPFLKDSKDRYSDSKTKNTEKDKHYKRSSSEREHAHTGEGKFSKKSSSANRHDEKKSHENNPPKGNAHFVKTEPLDKDKHCHKENNQTVNKKELSAKQDRLADAFDELFEGSKIKKEDPSNEGRKRSFEDSFMDSHSNIPNQENKKRKISKEVDKQNLSNSSNSHISPDSTSGPDTTEKLAVFGGIEQNESPLDARIRKMMSHGDFDTKSGKKRRHESVCSEDTSGCFSDVTQLSNETVVKAEVMPFTSPEEQKHLVSSLKDSSEQKSSRELKEEIASEIKLILKPFFAVGVVNKEDYKDIMRRAVPKVFVNCGNFVNPEKIKKLVLGYVAKLKNS